MDQTRYLQMVKTLSEYTGDGRTGSLLRGRRLCSLR